MTLDFYAYWNGAQAADLFRAVAMMTGGASYSGAVKFAALFGFLCAVAAAMVRNRGGDILTWIASFVLLYFVALLPKADVNVQDPHAMTVETVSGVPLGAAFAACASSSIGRWAAETFETAFADVDAAKFTKFGAVFPERAAAAIRSAGPLLSETRALLTPYVERCVMPEILSDDAKLARLMQADDLTALIGGKDFVNPARFIAAEGEILYCDAALERLKRRLEEKEIPAQEKLLTMKLGSSSGNELLEAALKRALPEADALMTGISRPLSQSLAHSLLSMEIPAAAARLAGKSGVPVAASIRLSKAQGNLASEISFRTMSEVAAAFLPKLRNLLEFLLIASFPIVFLMMAALGEKGTGAVRMYATLFLWLALWAPMSAVVNYLLVHLDANPMNRLVEAYGGVTLEAAAVIREAGASSQAMAGYLMLLVPMLSYLIAKASDMGAASLASGVMRPAESAAQAQSANLAMGNVSAGNASLGNASINNANANKSDLSTGFAAGNVQRTTTPYGSVTRDASTGAVSGMRLEASDLGVAARLASASGTTTENARVEGESFTSSETAAHESSVGSSSVYTSQERRESSAVHQSGRSYSEGVSEREGWSQGMRLESAQSAEMRSSANVQEGIGVSTKGSLNAKSGEITHAEVDELNPVNGEITKSHSGMEGSLLSGNVAPNISQMVSPQTNKSRTSKDGGILSQVAGKYALGAEFDLRLSAGHTDTSGISQREASSSNFTEESASTKTIASAQEASERNASLRSNGEVSAYAEDERSALRKGESTARTENASRMGSHRESRGEQKSVSADLSRLALVKASEIYGSPERALEALAQDPEAAAGFASELARSLESVPSRSALPSDRADQTIAARWDRAHTRLSSLGTETSPRRRLEDDPAPAVPTLPYEAPTSERENRWLAIGAAKAAQHEYDGENVGVLGLGKILLTAGLAYTSPQEKFQALVEMSKTDPELRGRLIEIGRSQDAVH